MAFGRRKKDQDPADGDAAAAAAGGDAAGAAAPVPPTEPAPTEPVDSDEGPFDIEDFDSPEEAAQARLDLGSVLVPLPAAGQIQVELSQTGVPNAVWVVTANGRFTIAAYAAPKSPGQWREVAAELAEALRNDGASVSIQDGPWGREVVGTGAGVVRFIGVDGYRWMIRCVVNGIAESMDALVAEARTALTDAVVRRGETPLPARTPLEVRLPEQLAAQLRAAAAQQQQQAMVAAQEQQQAMLAAQEQQQAQQARQAMVAQQLQQQQHQQLLQQQQQAGRPQDQQPVPDSDGRHRVPDSDMQQLRGGGDEP